MYKNSRPRPINLLSVEPTFKRMATMKPECKSPVPKITQSLFTNCVKQKGINNMKIFDANNDEGVPKHWDDKFKSFINENSHCGTPFLSSFNKEFIYPGDLTDGRSHCDTMLLPSGRKVAADPTEFRTNTEKSNAPSRLSIASKKLSRRRLNSYQCPTKSSANKGVSDVGEPFLSVNKCNSKSSSKEDSCPKEIEEAKKANIVLEKCFQMKNREVARLTKRNQELVNKISSLEKELEDVKESLRKQERMWIKSVESSSPKTNASETSPNQEESAVIKTRAKRINSGENPRIGVNCKQNSPTLLRQKYFKRIEDLQKKHEKDMNLLRKSFAKQLEDLTELAAQASNEAIRAQDNAAFKCKSFFDIIIEKDILIEELEDKLSKATQEFNEIDSDSKIYKLKSCISVLRTNLKLQHRENKEMESLNSRLKSKVIELKKKVLKFDVPTKHLGARLKSF
ncbi:unnamed protein product [Moneuplotes crassus]|uniref:Uncharacterized protein n=1 Tax=Euplotes crassus TaxID=5936 RepID=A0AAD1U2R7_EUPCR|nr:unnamed protein product [Moneuplotes crassus]